MIQRLILISTLLYLGGCAATSVDIQHLQLTAGDAPLPRGEHPVIVLAAIDLPDYLLRDDLVLRESDVSLRYDSTRRWAEPLDLGIQRVLGRRLQAELGTQQLILFPHASAEPADWQLQVRISQFEAHGATAKLAAEARWEQFGDEGILTSVVFDESLDLENGDGETIAKALSQLLWRLSQALAAAISPNLTPSPESSVTPIEN